MKKEAANKRRVWELDSEPLTDVSDKPMKTTVVTGWHPPAFELYADTFVTTFMKHWPKAVDLIFYTEEPIMGPEFCRKADKYQRYNVTERSLWAIPGVKEFIDSHQHPRYHGLDPVPGWQKKDFRAGGSYRYDAVKFCKQLFIPDHATERLPDGEILAWFDADVVTYADVPDNFIQSLLGPFDLVTVGRDRGHTDIGFWAIRIGPNTRKLLNEIADSYRSGYVLKLEEWHSAFLFDHWKDKFKAEGLIRHKSLTRGNGHVWFNCDLGKYTDHLKGPSRKALGYSPERDGTTMKQFVANNYGKPSDSGHG